MEKKLPPESLKEPGILIGPREIRENDDSFFRTSRNFGGTSRRYAGGLLETQEGPGNTMPDVRRVQRSMKNSTGSPARQVRKTPRNAQQKRCGTRRAEQGREKNRLTPPPEDGDDLMDLSPG